MGIFVYATHPRYLDVIPYPFLKSTLRAKAYMKTVKQQIHSNMKLESTCQVRPSNP